MRVPFALTLALAALGACSIGADSEMRSPQQPAWLDHAQAAQGSARRQLLQGGLTYVPLGGKGKWESGGSTGLPMIYANLMQDGEVVGWSTTFAGPQKGLQYGTVVWAPWKKGYATILPKCGIQDCKASEGNAFCSGQVTTADNRLLIFGGHGDERDLTGFRAYNHGTGRVVSTKMASGRWYPTPCTLPDGRVLVVGGVKHNGQGGYTASAPDRGKYDNPTYVVFDPKSNFFGPERREMQAQLNVAWPIHLFPQVVLLPDGGVAVSAGSTLVKYKRTGGFAFERAFAYKNRPHAPWSYPQTGVGLPLPMYPPYNRLLFLATGGTSRDLAKAATPASDAAHLIDLTAGPGAPWVSLGPMPFRRVMGDGLYLCDGTIGFFGGAQTGIASWSPKPMTYTFKDGSQVRCNDQRCSFAENPVYEASIFDPATGRWSARGSLGAMMRMRLYHSTAILLPDCRVMLAGSDVTKDTTAEIYTPPHLLMGPRPIIAWAPAVIRPATLLTLRVLQPPGDPIVKALLLRTGAATHSMFFDARALWLTITFNAGGVLTLVTPPTYNVMPPGMYLLTVVTARGIPSEAKILSNFAP